MAREIDQDEEELTPKRGRPKKLDEDAIFGHDIDSDEEKRLREENEIATILDREDASTSTIVVNRRATRTERYAHLSEIGLKDYNREEIARQYGGGEYRCRIRRSDGSFGPTWYFSVDKSRKADLEGEQNAGTAGGYDAVRLVETVASKLSEKQSGPDMGSIVTMMSDKSDKMMQMMFMNQQESTKMMVGMMTAMATAMSGRPQASSDSALTGISTMLLKHSLESSKTSMDDMLGTIIKLKKLAGEDADDDSEPEKGSFVQDIVGAIPQLMRTIFPGQPAQALPAEAPATAPTPGPVPVVIPPKELSAQEKMETIFPALIQFAEQKSNPVEVHDFYQQLISDEEYEAVATYLESIDWWERLAKNMPMMAPHREWFTSLRDIILQDVEEDEASPSDADSEASPVVGVGPRIVPKPRASKNGNH